MFFFFFVGTFFSHSDMTSTLWISKCMLFLLSEHNDQSIYLTCQGSWSVLLWSGLCVMQLLMAKAYHEKSMQSKVEEKMQSASP